MASNKAVNTAIQVVLAIVIVGLAYYLYRSITEPWEVVERQQELTRLTRDRMDQVRTAMIRYEDVHGRYPMTLDSLVMFTRQDSLLSLNPDSVFEMGPGERFNADSFVFSPRSGKRFVLQVNDTARVKTYLLQDPDSEDHIGTIESDVTRLNAASWE